MVAVVNIETSSKDAIQIEKEQMVKRLEKQKAELEKQKAKHKKLGEIMMAVTMASVFLGVPLGFKAVDGSNLMTFAFFSTFVSTSLSILVGAKSTLKSEQINDKLEEVRKEIRMKADPQAHFKAVLEKEQKRLKVCEDAKKGTLDTSYIYDIGMDSVYVEEFTKKASEKLPIQKQIVSVLEAAQDFIEKGCDKSELYKIIDLAENPTEENIASIQKLISPEQKTNKTNVNLITKLRARKEGRKK